LHVCIKEERRVCFENRTQANLGKGLKQFLWLVVHSSSQTNYLPKQYTFDFEYYTTDHSQLSHIIKLYLLKEPSTSRTYAIPPDIPAAKLRPVKPRITTHPPVIYSQPWSPTPCQHTIHTFDNMHTVHSPTDAHLLKLWLQFTLKSDGSYMFWRMTIIRELAIEPG